MNQTANRLRITALLTAAALSAQAQASGYHFGTQSVTAQSTANAAAAEAADAATIFYNPAGLAKLDGSEVTAALNIVAPHIAYGDAEAEYFRGGSVRGETSGKITKDIVPAPHLYGAYRASNDLTLGLGIYIPFASSTEYQKNSVLRHNLNQLGLTTVAIEPVAAYKINDRHAAAAGLIAQYSTAELRKYADWNASGRLGAHNGLSDGHAEVKGKDWGFGYQLGWLWDIDDRTRVGLNYRSKISHDIKGTADWTPDGAAVTTPSPLLGGKNAYDALISTVSGYKPHEKAHVKIVTPESLSVHGMYQATAKTKLFADLTWTRHSRFNRAELIFENSKAAVNGRSDRTVITPNWRNTYKLALGGAYQYSEPLQLRAGLAFDQSPVRDAQSRLNTLPDGNRIWYSAGVKYTHKKRHVFDIAYSHIHINDTRFQAAAASGYDVDSKGRASASFKNHADILGLQYTYKF